MRTRALLLATCLALLASCGKADSPSGGGAPATVTTIVLRPSAWIDSLDALATVRANESVTITAKVSETVTQVHFESGDVVKAGQALVTLSGQAQQAALAEADANYKEAQSQFLRQQDLVARQLVAASQFETQRAARDAAKARLNQMRAQLSDRVITAPFAGVLGARQVSEGALVTPGTVITTLDDLTTVRLDFTVPERQLQLLANGQAVIARSDAYPDQAFQGRITSLDSRIDPVTRAIAVQARLANPERKLHPGMLLDVAVQRPARQTLQVPELALQQVGQQAYVFRVGADDKVEQVPVAIGARKSGAVEIVDGVKAGDRVVVEGTVKLHPGSKIVEAGTGTGTGTGTDDGSGHAATASKRG